MKIITIGDLHGMDTWKEIVEIEKDVDKYIFLGDYVDSFDIDNIFIKKNLLEVIDFKKENPDNVILLWGNHEQNYLSNNQDNRCSGFRPEVYFDLNEIFNKNRDLFQLAYQIEDTIWSHAGIHIGWYNKAKIEEKLIDNLTIANVLNQMFLENKNVIFDVGRLRGGFNNIGGPLWCDKRMLQKKPIKSYNQVVGHSRVSDITHVNNVTFCDCLQTKFEYYILEI